MPLPETKSRPAPDTPPESVSRVADPNAEMRVSAGSATAPVTFTVRSARSAPNVSSRFLSSPRSVNRPLPDSVSAFGSVVIAEFDGIQMPPPVAMLPSTVTAPDENAPLAIGFTHRFSIHVPPVYVFAAPS